MIFDLFLSFFFEISDAEKNKENPVEESESGVFITTNGNVSSEAITPQQFEALKQEKNIWEQGIVM